MIVGKITIILRFANENFAFDTSGSMINTLPMLIRGTLIREGIWLGWIFKSESVVTNIHCLDNIQTRVNLL